MSPNVALRQERKRIADEMAALVERGMSTSEQRERFDRLDAEQKRLKAEIDRLEGHVPESGFASAVQTSGDRRYAGAYDAYLRHGFERLTDDERGLLSEKRATIGVEGTPTGGAYPGSTAGFTVPVGFVADVERAMLFSGDMMKPGLCRIVRTETGGPLPFPTSNDTSISAEIIAEGSANNIQDVNTGILNLYSFKYSSKIVKASVEVLQDSQINIPEFLSTTFGERFGRKLNHDFLLGAGTTEPTGILTALVANSAPSVTAVGAGSNDGSSAANTIGSDDLVKLMHALDPNYRSRATFMMHDSTLGSLQQLKDKYGRPLWAPGLTVGTPDTLFGRPYALNNSMDALQANAASPTVSKKTVIFADFSKYVIRVVREMTVFRLTELYMANGQVGFLAFARYDGNLLDAGTHPGAYLVNVY